MKKRVWSRVLSICTAGMLLCSCVGAAAAYIKNDSFTALADGSPLYWQLSGGAGASDGFSMPMPGAEECIGNGGFEVEAPGETGAPDGWKAYWGPWNGAKVKRISAAARSGNYGAALYGVSTDTMAALYEVENVVAGASYQLSGYAKIIGTEAGGRLTLSQYNGDAVLSTVQISVPTSAADWTRVYSTFTLSEHCTKVVIGARQDGEGTIYYDDISFYMTKAPEIFSFETEDIFHYAERGVGKAHVRLNPYYDTVVTDAQVSFSVSDGINVLQEKKNISFTEGTAEWEYSIADFAMYKEYTLTARVTGSAGENVFVQDIYKYPRPTSLQEDGTYVDGEGEPFVPVIAYHPGSDFEKLREIGINVVEISASNAAAALANLDKAEAAGVKALVSLFCGPAYMYPAGHPENMTTTAEVVKAVHNHPAVFAYAVQDEPYGGIAEHMDRWLSDAYKLIHAIDSVHPIYAVDYVTDGYSRLGKRVDVLATDVYPHQADSHKVSDSVRAGVNAVYGRKPVYCITQVFKGRGSSYLPTADDIRGQIYRALAEGAQGIGFYSIAKALGHSENEAETPLYEIADRWSPLVSFAEVEMPMLLSHFAREEGKLFCCSDPGGNRGVYYRGWTVNSKLYLAVQNRGTEAEDITLPLTSTDGRVTVQGFSARAISRGETAAAYTGDALSVHLSAGEAVFYEIVPNTAINETLLPATARKGADEPQRMQSVQKAASVPEESEENGAVLSLPVKGAAAQQYIYGLSAEKSYVLSIEYESSVADSVQLQTDFYVQDINGFNAWNVWCESTGTPHIQGEEKYIESFGSAIGADTFTVDFMMPKAANAMKLTLSAAKKDAELKIHRVRLKETETNLLRNGNFQFVKSENRLTGCWSAYYEYPLLYNNVAEVREENGRSFLYMTEAENWKAGTSANARQKAALYEGGLYKFSFLYKDMGGAPKPTAGVSSGTGRCIVQGTAGVAEEDGWTRYTLYIRPVESGMHTIWLGGPDAKGAYAFAEVRLTSEVMNEVTFFAIPENTVTAEGCAQIFQKITTLSDVETENGKKKVYVWNTDENACIAVYDYTIEKELAGLVWPKEENLIECPVSADGLIRVFVWQTGSMRPAGSAVTLK